MRPEASARHGPPGLLLVRISKDIYGKRWLCNMIYIERDSYVSFNRQQSTEGAFFFLLSALNEHHALSSLKSQSD